jgi:hypothetical protein
MLVGCREMTFENITVLQHRRIDNVTEDEFTMLQRTENVLSLRVDALKKKLSLYSISRRRLNGGYNIYVLSGRDGALPQKHVSQLKERECFQTIMKNQRFFRLNGGKLDLPNMEERTVEILEIQRKELKCEDELSFHRKTSLLEVTFTELLRNKLLTV